MHTHLSLSCLHSHARFFSPYGPKGQRKDFFFKCNFFKAFFLGEVAGGQVTGSGHGRFPCRGQALGSPRAQRAAAASRSRRFCSITVALRTVRGEARLPPRQLVRGVPFREMLLRPSPPFPASRAAAPPGTPRRALRAAPSPWKFPQRPGTAILPRASPPCPPGPSLPTPPGEEKNSLSSVNSAARRSLPLRPGLRRQTPGDWWKSRSPPPSPTRKFASFDPFRSATLAWSARLSLPPLFSGDRGKQ